MIPTRTIVSNNKFKVTVSRKRKEATLERESFDLRYDEWNKGSTFDGGKKLEKRRRINCVVDSSRQDCQPKCMFVDQMIESDPDSGGAVRALDDAKACPNSQATPPATDAAPQGGCSDSDVQLSPKKALRAAMLKSRYAETILKAKQKTLLDIGNKADPLKMQQEKKRWERKQREEIARIKEEMNADETASRIKEEAELKQQREREREAFRASLQKMTRTVDGENLWIQREFDMLLGCSLSYDGSLTR